MIYTFNYRSQFYGDTISVDVVHNGHNPTELYRYVYKELFYNPDDDDDDVLTIDTSSADDIPTDDIENNSDGDLIPF